MELDPLTRATGLSADEFAARHWARAPLLRRAAELPGDGFTDLLSLAAVDELVSRRGLRTPFLRMAKEGDVLAPRRFTRGGGRRAPTSPTRPPTTRSSPSSRAAPRWCCRACTACGRRWCRSPPALSEQLGHPVQVNAYITPAQNRGFAPHYDVHDVFVLQFAGRKHWTIHEPVLEAPLRASRGTTASPRSRPAPRASRVIDTVLEPGDALYLPRGYLHAASALGGVSGHLTIGRAPRDPVAARRAGAADPRRRPRTAPLPAHGRRPRRSRACSTAS